MDKRNLSEGKGVGDGTRTGGSHGVPGKAPCLPYRMSMDCRNSKSFARSVMV